MRYIIALFVVAMLLAVGCSTQDPLAGYCDEGEEPMVICRAIEEIELEPFPIDEQESDEKIDDIEDDVKEDEQIEDEIVKPIYRDDVEHSIVKTYFEGDLVSFADIDAYDPDGRDVTITFGNPLNEKGEWQTKEGDEGTYTIEIEAYDSIDKSIAYVMVIINKKNTPPQIIVNDTITVLEGEEVFIDAKVIDPDDDDIKITFSGWMTSPVYQTTYDDAGEYMVTITTSDGIDQVSKDVKIIVVDVNRKPIIEKPNYDIIALEGELIELDLNIYDLDEDELTITYSEPFNNEGKWQTKSGDAGEYNIIVTANDNKEVTSISLPVKVQRINNPPVLTLQNVIEVDEGEIVYIEVEAYDPDEDELTITYSGWMNSNTYTTNYDDSGEYIVTVTVSDGIESVSKDVTIIVNDVNRPPVFIWE
jgi:hypothetical protein